MNQLDNELHTEELPLKVLIVDDLLQARRILTKLLKKLGISQIFEAEGLGTALASLTNHPVDIIIADLNLKDGTGLELIRKLRSAPATASLPVIIITSDADRSQVVEGAELGVAGFLLKPFDKNMLLEKIEEALGSA